MSRRALIGVAAVWRPASFGWLRDVGARPTAEHTRGAAAPMSLPKPRPWRRPRPPNRQPGRRSRPRLFFASADGQRLVGVQQDVPLAEGAVAQARALLEARCRLNASRRARLDDSGRHRASRHLRVGSQRGCSSISTRPCAASIRGGSTQELLTVYTMVNTLTVNLSTIAAVQILIDGHEADTLAGHVDLRRPLRKNEALIAPSEPHPEPLMTRHDRSRPRRTAPDQDHARTISIHAEGSVLIEVGHTRVICTASIEDNVPPFLRNTGKGWVTAEYGMLPRATSTRSTREASSGKVGGRTMEIQRLIGRSMRIGHQARTSWASGPSGSTATSSRPTAAPAPRPSPAHSSRSRLPASG